jgi:hypothetical protein
MGSARGRFEGAAMRSETAARVDSGSLQTLSMKWRSQTGSTVVNPRAIPEMMIRRPDEIAGSPVAGVIKHLVQSKVIANTQSLFIISSGKRTTAEGHGQ